MEHNLLPLNLKKNTLKAIWIRKYVSSVNTKFKLFICWPGTDRFILENFDTYSKKLNLKILFSYLCEKKMIEMLNLKF